MAYQRQYRYPGITPFTTEQTNIFFGRKQDTEEVYRLIRRESLVVLYGKSGLGKSSLLNAGIVPRCGQENVYNPVVVRFGAWIENITTTPLSITKAAVYKDFEVATFLDRLLPDDTSLWHYAKNRQLNGGGRLLLLFDQFEELFSYPEKEVRAFEKDLSELLNTGIPLRFRRMADASNELTDDDEDRFETPLEVRIVFAIRSDRMHLLDRLKTNLPTVLRHCYELKALTKKDAIDAIILPAKAEGDFYTQPFSFQPAALDKLLEFLQDEKDQRIEGILLQMLCEYYERKLVEVKKLSVLGSVQIGDPGDVVKNYYQEKIATLPNHQQLPAQLLIEEGLVSEGEAMRLTLHEAYIIQEFGVTKTLLEKLVDSRLLRSEPFLRGGYTYELSHDRLVPPVLHVRQLRREKEINLEAERLEQERQQKLEEAQKQAEQERKLRKQAEVGERRALQRTRLAFLVSLMAFVLAFFASWSYIQANNARAEADLQKEAVERQQRETQKNLDAYLQAQAQKDTYEIEKLEQEGDELTIAYPGIALVKFQMADSILQSSPAKKLLHEKEQILQEKIKNTQN